MLLGITKCQCWIVRHRLLPWLTNAFQTHSGTLQEIVILRHKQSMIMSAILIQMAKAIWPNAFNVFQQSPDLVLFCVCRNLKQISLYQRSNVLGVEWTKSTKACCQQPFLPRSVGHGRRNLATFAPSLRRIKPLFSMPIVIKRAKVPVWNISSAKNMFTNSETKLLDSSCWVQR